MKQFFLPGAIVLVLILGIAGFILLKPGSKSTPLPQSAGQKQIINALPFAERPFVALVPHSSNRLLTLYFDKPGQGQNISLDIEYLAGSSLKGGRTAVSDLNNMPHTAAFLLGSCSTGGKCSFDTEITTGTLKTKLEIGSDLHVLRSNFVFGANQEVVTTDQKLAFKPNGKPSLPLIISQTHGFIGQLTQEVAAEPVAIASANSQKVTGTLTIYAPQASQLLIYDGTSYQPLPSTKNEDRLVANLNLSPWTKTVDIIRDDEKGSVESTTLYLVGPIVPIK